MASLYRDLKSIVARRSYRRQRDASIADLSARGHSKAGRLIKTTFFLIIDKEI